MLLVTLKLSKIGALRGKHCGGPDIAAHYLLSFINQYKDVYGREVNTNICTIYFIYFFSLFGYGSHCF